MTMSKLSATEYHRGTVHPDGELFDPAHRWDPGHRPRFRKDYAAAEQLALPEPHEELGVSIWDALGWRGSDDHNPALTLDDLSLILHYSNGITKRIKRPSWDRSIPFRASACTGGLFHIEIYVVTGGLSQLPPGVYYYDPEGHCLAVLRQGDHRAWLSQAAGEEQSIASAQATLVFTDEYWRNAIKYQAREYRHAWWDLGTMLANSLAVANAMKQKPRLVLGFLESQVEALLGISGEHEFPLALQPIGEARAPGKPGDRDQETPAAARQEGFRKNYPPVEAIQASVSLTDDQGLKKWREGGQRLRDDRHPDSLRAGDSPVSSERAPDLLTVIRRRGSTRLFAREPISEPDLKKMLQLATIPACRTDLGLRLGGQISQPYLLANAVEGLSTGSFRWDADFIEIEKQDERANRRASAQLALGQDLGGDAAAAIYFLVDLEMIVAALGDRGYRVAQLDASVAAGRIYLAAYALGLGATGLTFYDNAVVDQFSTAGGNDEVMFLIAVGRPGY